MANKAVHQTLGFRDGVAMIESPPMFQELVEGEMVWKRCYYNKQEGAQSRINQNDTDAVFYQISDLQWFKDALAAPETYANAFTTV